LRFFSNSSVCRPRSALRVAANSPAAPAPMTATSHLLVKTDGRTINFAPLIKKV
jgi:hypothetical protein